MSSPTQTTGPTLRTTTTEQTGIHYSTIYLHTVPGTVKCVCLIFTLLGFICAQFSGFAQNHAFFCTIAMICFWFTGVLLVLYLFHVIYVFSKVPWIKVEFFFCVAAALFLGLTSALIVSDGAQSGWLTGAGFFGFVAMCAYGYDAWLKYQMYNTIVTNVVTRTTTVTVA